MAASCDEAAAAVLTRGSARSSKNGMAARQRAQLSASSGHAISLGAAWRRRPQFVSSAFQHVHGAISVRKMRRLLSAGSAYAALRRGDGESESSEEKTMLAA